MGKIQIGRDNKRDYESVKFFSESVKPENEAADEVRQDADTAEVAGAQAEQARQEVQEEPVQAQQATEKKEVPVAKQSRKKGGKR